MAASAGQGRSLTTFLVGLTVTCAGIAYFSSGSGKLLTLLGAGVLLASLAGFRKLKPLEGKPAQNRGAGTMKLLGAFIACFGWILILFGLHVVTGTGGRIVLGLLGIGVSLVGIVYVLPAAFNKNAIWKV
ncbi:MAG: hypothetical protein LAO22_04520 [Acidobacteriia bacterium]|nr:hypothetical protein [Terriglobia bacterium]